MIMQARAMRDCSHIAECSNKAGKRSFTRLDTAEPQPVICKDNIKYFILLLP